MRALVWDELTWHAADGSLYNSLAEDFSSNSNATVWKIRLRDGVRFSDGSPFTASDVAYTLNYILNPKNTAEGLSNLNFLSASGIHVNDPTTLTLTLDSPL